MGQSGIAVHDFDERLRYSEAASEEPFWDAVYHKAFPTLVNHMLCSGDTQSQRLGIDRLIVLSSGKVLAIDEKKRSRDYPDILLEYLSNDTTGAPGWIEKDLQIDYLAYAFMPSQRVYLYPWEMLKRAWRNFRDEWLDLYKIPPARNKGYRTHSVAVPISILHSAVNRAMIIQL